MKSLIILFFIFIVCYICDSSGENETSINAQLDRFDNKTLLKYFDELPLQDLIDLADENPRFRELIATHTAIHRFRLHEKGICLENEQNSNKVILPTKRQISYINCDIIICDPSRAFKFLRSFGHIISKIFVFYGVDHPYPIIFEEAIDKYINEYCSDSLKKLQMTMTLNKNRNLSLNSTYMWNKPFKHITDLTVFGKFDIYGNKNFSEIFPSLRSMTTRETSISDFMVHHLPQLEQVKFQVISENELRFFELNPQLQSVEIDDSKYHIGSLRAVSERIENLELIKLNIRSPITPDGSNELIHFKNVKRCVLDITYLQPQSPIQIVFDNIEKMEVELLWVDDRITFTEFLLRHKTLTYLEIVSSLRKTNLAKLLSIVESLPNLTELNIPTDTVVDDEALITLMIWKTDLKKIHVNTTGNIKRFRNSLNLTWEVECIRSNRFIFTRKEYNF